MAALAHVLPREDLPRATAQSEPAFAAAQMAGPSLGKMANRFHGMRPAGPPRALRHEIAEGLGWLWRQPLIRYMAGLTGTTNFVGAATVLLLIALARRLGASDVEFELVFSIGGIGGVLGSLIGGQVQRRFSFGQAVCGVTWAQALLLPLYAWMPRFGLLRPVYNVLQFSYRVALIPDALQGRVNSSFRLVAFGFNPLGAALCGLLLETWATLATVALFGSFHLAMAVLTQLNPHVRHAQPLAAAQ